MCEECESERATTLVFRLHRQTDTHIHTLTWNNTGFIITHGEHPFLSPFMEMRARPPVSVLCVWFTRTPTCFGKFSAYTSTCSTRFPLDNTFAWRLRTHPHRRKHRLNTSTHISTWRSQFTYRKSRRRLPSHHYIDFVYFPHRKQTNSNMSYSMHSPLLGCIICMCECWCIKCM